MDMSYSLNSQKAQQGVHVTVVSGCKPESSKGCACDCGFWVQARKLNRVCM